MLKFDGVSHHWIILLFKSNGIFKQSRSFILRTNFKIALNILFFIQYWWKFQSELINQETFDLWNKICIYFIELFGFQFFKSILELIEFPALCNFYFLFTFYDWPTSKTGVWSLLFLVAPNLHFEWLFKYLICIQLTLFTTRISYSDFNSNVNNL